VIVVEEKKETNPPTGGEENLVHNFEGSSSLFTRKLIIILVVVALLGVGTGYYLGQTGGKAGMINLKQTTDSGGIGKGTIEGSTDISTFKDTVEGTLKIGGVDGEGAFHLERPGGESQNVYLTSSIVDLSKYVGKKIKVWGQTQKAQTAGWLMDVGKIQVL
jgi:hypothetical protein